MTIDEAIEHAKEKGKECSECGKEHLQLAEWLEELKDLKAKDLEAGRDRTAKIFYESLSEGLDEVVKTVLGCNYYNEACDRFSCDKFICRDLKAEFKHLKRTKFAYGITALISSLAFISSIFYII